jgi:hypothetical protein
MKRLFIETTWLGLRVKARMEKDEVDATLSCRLIDKSMLPLTGQSLFTL